MDDRERSAGGSPTVRRSLIGAAVGGGAMGVSGLVGAVVEGAPFPGVVQPLLVFVVLAATVGGLIGPLVGAALARRRARRRD